jgi:hypothetical protein
MKEEASFDPTSCIYVQTVINGRLGKIGWMHSWDGVLKEKCGFRDSAVCLCQVTRAAVSNLGA